MTWEDMLKTRRISKKSRDLVDELMSDGKKRSSAEVHDQLYDLNEKKIKDKKNRTSTTHSIPTKREITGYLSRSKKYSSERTGGSNVYFLKSEDVEKLSILPKKKKPKPINRKKDKPKPRGPFTDRD
jgi:hypothetical protein